MISFLKSILKGLLYVLFFPFGILFICIYAVFGLFVFIFQFGKLIYLFFTGRSFKNELKEDIEVRSIIEAQSGENKEEEKSSEPALSLYPSDSDMYSTEYTSPTFSNKKEDEEINNSSLEENGDEGHD